MWSELDVRRELDPVDAENSIATLEEKIRRQLALGGITTPLTEMPTNRPRARR